MTNTTIKLQGPPYLPFLSMEAIEFYESILQPDFEVFEYGSGSSTVWLAERVKHVVSVEHCRKWHEAVSEQTHSLPVTLGLIEFDKTDPDAGEKVSEYVDVINGFPDGFFDIVSCDGNDEARSYCIIAAPKKVKPGGWLVIDDLAWSPVTNGIALAGIDEWYTEQHGGPIVGFDPENPAGPGSNTTGFYRKPAR